jgi:hypothetical protein
MFERLLGENDDRLYVESGLQHLNMLRNYVRNDWI